MDNHKIQMMEIERFAIHDGPGIRSVVFFQGCPLHCPWCANPESQKMKSHLLHNENKCVNCGYCIEQCPQNALYVDQGHIRCNDSKCVHCNECVRNCLESALRWVGEKRTVKDVLKEIAKDDAYYAQSQGGVTLSGGEVFVQFENLKCLLKELKAKQYHTSIETCGEFKTELLDEVLDKVDLFLFDMKHSKEEVFHQVTGGHLNLVKQNIQKIAQYNPEHIIIRVPVIPGFNDEYEVIEEIVSFAYQKQISTVQLLPFHNLGKSKYSQMGLKYQYDALENMDVKHLDRYKPIFEKYHMKGIFGNKAIET